MPLTTQYPPNIRLAQPKMLAFFDRLNHHDITWALYCGGAAQFLTNNRQSQDIDIVVSDKDFYTTINLVPHTAIIYDEPKAQVACGDGLVLDFPRRSIRFELDGNDIEIMATTTASSRKHAYHLAISSLAMKHRLMFELGKTQLYVSHPFDTMAIKAVLQRGVDMKKHDAEDIAALNKWQPLDREYARKRASEIQLDTRAIDFLSMCGVEFAATPVQTIPTYGILYAY